MLVTVGRRRVPADMSARLPPVMPDPGVWPHVDLSFGQAARPVRRVLQRTAAPAVRSRLTRRFVHLPKMARIAERVLVVMTGSV